MCVWWEGGCLCGGREEGGLPVCRAAAAHPPLRPTQLLLLLLSPQPPSPPLRPSPPSPLTTLTLHMMLCTVHY